MIESCCADGMAFKPAFVFSGKSVDEENVEADDDIWSQVDAGNPIEP